MIDGKECQAFKCRAGDRLLRLLVVEVARARADVAGSPATFINLFV
jgi:hypothetical protein